MVIEVRKEKGGRMKIPKFPIFGGDVDKLISPVPFYRGWMSLMEHLTTNRDTHVFLNTTHLTYVNFNRNLLHGPALRSLHVEQSHGTELICFSNPRHRLLSAR